MKTATFLKSIASVVLAISLVMATSFGLSARHLKNLDDTEVAATAKLGKAAHVAEELAHIGQATKGHANAFGQAFEGVRAKPLASLPEDAVKLTGRRAQLQAQAQNDALARAVAEKATNAALSAEKTTQTSTFGKAFGEATLDAGSHAGPRYTYASETRAWRERPFTRGQIIEKEMGQNLHQNFETIDHFTFEVGNAISIKSIDLGASTYQNASKFKHKLKKYIDQVARYEGGELGNFIIEPHQITGRTLDLGVPTRGSSMQEPIMRELQDYATSLGVKFNIIIKGAQ